MPRAQPIFKEFRRVAYEAFGSKVVRLVCNQQRRTIDLGDIRLEAIVGKRPVRDHNRLDIARAAPEAPFDTVDLLRTAARTGGLGQVDRA